MKKIVSFILCLSLLLSCVACGGKTDPGKTDPEQPGSETTEHLQSGTLHKSNVTENSGRVFAENGETDYVIVTGGASDYITQAVSLIVTNVKAATGAALSTASLTDEITNGWTSEKKYIVIGCDALFEKAGLTMPTENLGESGCYVKNVGNTVFIAVKGSFGYQTGAIKLLEALIGYDMLAENCVVYEKDGATMPDIEIIDKPDYDYRLSSNYAVSKDARYGMGYNMASNNDLFMAVPNRATGTGNNPVHNSFDYLPPSMYQTEHPDWYYQPGVEAEEQLCYTARGAYLTADEDKKNGVDNEYNKMVETLYEYLKQIVDANPDMHNITITHQDNTSYCACEACTAAVSKYGAISSVYIMFLNRVDDLLQADLEREAEENGTEKREVNIAFFAYHGTKHSPTVKNADGTFSPSAPEVVMNKNVGVYVAAIESYYTESFYEETNAELGESDLIKSWTCLTDNVYMWLYSTHFTSYMYPYASWESIVENYRYCYENNGKSMFYQGQGPQKNPTGFTKLKEYVDSKASRDVNVSYAELEQKFFKYYFADASDVMYEYFVALRSRLAVIQQTDASITGRLNVVPDSKKHWQRQTLLGYLDYIDRAYAAIAKYETSDPDLYETLYKRILGESIFPRYALIDLYSSSYSDAELVAAKTSFINDNTLLKNTQESEHKTLKDLYTIWGY